MGTVLEDLPLHSGNLTTFSMLIITPSCSTSLLPVNSLTKAKEGYAAIILMAQDLQMRKVLSYMCLNHLMEIISAIIVQVTVFRDYHFSRSDKCAERMI